MSAPIHLFDEVSSTNDLALAGAQSGAEPGEAWLANRQLAGRGRREVGGERRSWHSPEGQSIYLSVVVRPKLDANDVPTITLAAGATIARALSDHTGVDIWLKWPNDLMVGDRKLAGILTEGVVGSTGFQAAVVGIGVNVHSDAASVPTELEDVMTSLTIETGRRFDRMTLALAIRAAVVEASETLETGGLKALWDVVQEFDRSHGRTVELDGEDGPRRGTARGIAEDGSLRVEIDGKEERLRSGEARLVTS